MQSSIKKKSTSNYEHFDSYNEIFEHNLAKLESPVKQIMGETGNQSDDFNAHRLTL